MINRKLLGIAITILAIAMLATPVFAASGGQKVDASIKTIGSEKIEYTDVHYSAGPNYVKGDIMQYSGIQVYYNILTIDGIQHYIYSYNTIDVNVNPKEAMAISHADAIWYVTQIAKAKQVTDSGFAGTVTYTSYGYTTPTTMVLKVHAVAHGFGEFEGQTLVLSYEGAPSGDWTGICIKG
jgi:hypothetical protein